jgi:hypothetical protein
LVSQWYTAVQTMEMLLVVFSCGRTSLNLIASYFCVKFCSFKRVFGISDLWSTDLKHVSLSLYLWGRHEFGNNLFRI